MTLPQLLEAGSWKVISLILRIQPERLLILEQGGREIAEINRPNTKEPPILIDSDGTVF
jgi:hypothetical protein